VLTSVCAGGLSLLKFSVTSVGLLGPGTGGGGIGGRGGSSTVGLGSVKSGANDD
jgi:hypothetical protein